MSSSHGGEGGRWMVSYADFLTLLFVLFVVLYSMGQTDLQKYKEMAESFQAAFSPGGTGSGGNTRVVDPLINSGGNISDEGGSPAPIVVEGLPQSSSIGEEVATDLMDLLEEADLSREVSIQSNVEGVLLSLSQQVLFYEGTSELQAEAYPVLDSMVEMLKPMDNDIKIIGHTDNTEPEASFQNNWVLSLVRSYTIINYLEIQGIDSGRLIASGRGEYSPIFPNDTPEHRAYNNRADIVIIYPQDVEDLMGSGSLFSQ
ncbi:MAG: flagellar motor protein MotB [Anaerolineaceae bacterium]|nr:flagellar motor protein MotB [Anaerolineaceae bacterium]